MADDKKLDLDGLKKSILDGIRGMRTTDPDDDLDELADGGSKRGTVPVYRLREVIRERNALRKQLSEVTGKVEELGAAYKRSLEEIKEQTAGEVQTIAARHQEDLALQEMGLDGDGRDVLRRHIERLPEDKRPKSPVDWWRELREQAGKGEEVEVPRPLSPYLEDAKGGTGGQTGGGKPNALGAARVDTGTRPRVQGDALGKVLANVDMDKGFDGFLAQLESVETPGG